LVLFTTSIFESLTHPAQVRLFQVIYFHQYDHLLALATKWRKIGRRSPASILCCDQLFAYAPEIDVTNILTLAAMLDNCLWHIDFHPTLASAAGSTCWPRLFNVSIATKVINIPSHSYLGRRLSSSKKVLRRESNDILLHPKELPALVSKELKHRLQQQTSAKSVALHATRWQMAGLEWFDNSYHNMVLASHMKQVLIMQVCQLHFRDYEHVW
jgi:hypothetical protein